MSIAAIDYARLYQEHLAIARARPKPPQAWDQRAGEMAQRAGHGRYAQDFIARMRLDDAHTLLDVGCGAGALALPLAARLKKVVALDYSAGMLKTLSQQAHSQGVQNIQPLLLSWDDDWSVVPVCDVVVASRSMVVTDLAAALTKLQEHARRRVYLTHLAGGHFIDPAIQQVIGRQRPAMPDYIYIINILHGMGIHPRLDYIFAPPQLAAATDFDDYARRVGRSMDGLTEAETERLRNWYVAATPPQRTGAPMRWAFIHWDKGD